VFCFDNEICGFEGGFAYGASLVLVVYHKLADFGVREKGAEIILKFRIGRKSIIIGKLNLLQYPSHCIRRTLFDIFVQELPVEVTS
jgi:hypothetical protein